MLGGCRVSSSTKRDVLAFVGLLAIAVSIQIGVGAYRTELGNYSDESAHFMNGLLLRDYLTTGLSQQPVAFAQDYYLSYPKIAPLMWPPLFHIVLGVVLLPGWSPHVAALLLLAFIATLAAWRMYRVTMVPWPVALTMAMLFLLTPVVIAMTTAVMLDVVIAALALEATYWLALYFANPRATYAALFGLLTAACCLTKGNGVALVLLPGVLMLFLRRFDALRRRGLYVAAAIVFVLAAPPLALTYHLDAAIGDFSMVTPAVATARVVFYSRFIWAQLGVVPSLLAILGIAEAFAVARDRSVPKAPFALALLALATSAFVFHVITPHSIPAGRYLVMALPPLWALVPLGMTRVLRLFGPVDWRSTKAIAFVTAVVVAFVAAHPNALARLPFGYAEVVRVLGGEGGLAGRRILVVADENGEGAFVTEVAMRHPATRGDDPARFEGSGRGRLEWQRNRTDLRLVVWCARCPRTRARGLRRCRRWGGVGQSGLLAAGPQHDRRQSGLSRESLRDDGRLQARSDAFDRSLPRPLSSRRPTTEDQARPQSLARQSARALVPVSPQNPFRSPFSGNLYPS